MSIITISRGTYSKGKEIAEKVAESLGYECVSRDVLIEASEHFNIPEIKLVRALYDAPSVLDRFSHGKERYIAYIEEALLEHVQKDDVVYHGLAGHFFLTGIAHVMMVRIINDLDSRVRVEMEREKMSEEKARQMIKKDDSERRKWALTLYGIDTSDASLYDLVVNLRKMNVEEAVDLICHAVRLPHFRSTPESQRSLDNRVLSSRVKNAIIKDWPNAQVSAEDGMIVVHTEAPMIKETTISNKISEIVEKIPGVKGVRVDIRPTSFMGIY